MMIESSLCPTLGSQRVRSFETFLWAVVCQRPIKAPCDDFCSKEEDLSPEAIEDTPFQDPDVTFADTIFGVHSFAVLDQ